MRADAVIIGGGPAGSSVGILLARAGWSVSIVEQLAFPRPKVCGEFLSAASLPLLRELGVAEPFLDLAGPEIRRVGVFARDAAVTADMPRLATGRQGWGRALGRDVLDSLLLERAIAAGVTIWQPYRATEVRAVPDGFVCTIAASSPMLPSAQTTRELCGSIVIAAHGSWETGRLPTQAVRHPAGPADLLGFKTRFAGSRLTRDLMPLLTFPGGYGGMVHTDHDRVSLSCCIRRDYLERCRREQPGAVAGDAVLAHIRRTCRPARDVLDGIEQDLCWRAAGPIRPGVRTSRQRGLFLVGNAAGEAHPVIADGISMALQSGHLLARCLLAGRSGEYARQWSRAMSWRIRTAAVVAHWAMHPETVALTLPLLRAFPSMLTQGARAAGKMTARIA